MRHAHSWYGGTEMYEKHHEQHVLSLAIFLYLSVPNPRYFVECKQDRQETRVLTWQNLHDCHFVRPSDRVRLKNANYAIFSGQIVRLERSIMR